MSPILIVTAICLGQTTICPVEMMQVAPVRKPYDQVVRTAGQSQAVILLQGLDLRGDGLDPAHPRFQSWQGSTSPLVAALQGSADVFSIAYAQNLPVEEIAKLPEFAEMIKRINDLGYAKKVILAHSAGGIVARHFIVEKPKAGITRVIQIGVPNAGAKLAEWAFFLKSTVPAAQVPFVESLKPAYRQALLQKCEKIPESVEFLCVVTYRSANDAGDTIVHKQSQWSQDLYEQKIPCVLLQGKHTEVVEHDQCIKSICGYLSMPVARLDRFQLFEKRVEFGYAKPLPEK